MSNSKSDDGLAIALFSELMACDQMIRTRLSKSLPKGMELSHFSVLNHMSHQGVERSPAQLARLFSVTKGAMTNTLSKLEAIGYIHIRPDWDDARMKKVSLSVAGMNARDNAVRAVTPIFDDVMQEMGVEEVKDLLPTLRHLRGALS
ncbi:MAG: MarR family transcriptional regulator [Rhodobacteraceae bacterium]|nr:MAG: MarR family transcriptional regulator [Paracoccaceae bacterium]